MRILHISALQIWSMDGKGGMPSLTETLKGHIREGNDIQIILPEYDLFKAEPLKQTRRNSDNYAVHIAKCSWFPILNRIRTSFYRDSGEASVPYPARWLLNTTMLLFLTFSLLRKALTIRKAGFTPHLIYAHNQYAALAGFLLRCLWAVPNVTRIYGTFLADLMEKPLVSFRYPTAAVAYRIPSSLLICTNDGTRGDEVASRFKLPDERFRFWQNGIDPPSEEPNISRDEILSRFGGRLRAESKWVLSCSRLSYWKRIDRIIRALGACRHKGVDCQLLVAGDGPERKSLVALAEELRVCDDVIWLGAVSHDDIWLLMNTADAFVITNDVTNRCNPLYEAAWAGLPVLSVVDPSTADLLRHRENALLSPKDDAEALGENLAEICTNKILAQNLSNAQKKLASSFWTWEERMRVEVEQLRNVLTTS